MNTASMAQVKARLSAYIKECEERPVVITRNRKPVAVLLAVTDDDELERLLMAHSKKLRAILDASERQIDEGKWLEHDEFWRRVAAKRRGETKKRKPAPRRTKRAG